MPITTTVPPEEVLRDLHVRALEVHRIESIRDDFARAIDTARRQGVSWSRIVAATGMSITRVRMTYARYLAAQADQES
jgi:2,4-dienoyl-CoA reductase-like NADH-dependent reductase (Old Yellow Enzyme family)